MASGKLAKCPRSGRSVASSRRNGGQWRSPGTQSQHDRSSRGWYGGTAKTVKAATAADETTRFLTDRAVDEEIQRVQFATKVIDCRWRLWPDPCQADPEQGRAPGPDQGRGQGVHRLGVRFRVQSGKPRSNQICGSMLPFWLWARWIKRNRTRRPWAMQILWQVRPDLTHLILGGADARKQLGIDANHSRPFCLKCSRQPQRVSRQLLDDTISSPAVSSAGKCAGGDVCRRHEIVVDILTASSTSDRFRWPR
jgi:hypothetical protein